MILPIKENIDKYLGEGIYGKLPVLSAIYTSPPSRAGVFLWPICTITGYTYSDYMDDRQYLIALDPQGLHIYCEKLEPNLQFIKFTDINKLNIRHGILDPFILSFRTKDKKRVKITDTNYLSSDLKLITQKETVDMFYESLKPMEKLINSGKYQ